MTELLTLTNDQLEVKISTLGAEVQSAKNLQDGFEYIWQADKQYWGRHAPILFPFIGRSNENSYLLNGQKYAMKQHGFLRDYDFALEEVKKDSAVLTFVSNAETLEVYPYDFTVRISYQLQGKQLLISYAITNNTDQEMYYSLGFHPAFNLEGDLSNYRLNFEPQTNSLTELLIDPAPFRSGKEAEVALKDSSLPVSYPMLDAGLRIYDAQKLREVILVSGHQHAIRLELSDFPYLAIWSPEEKHAPFLCVEGFRGLPDQYGKVGEIADKKGEQVIAPERGEVVSTSISFF